MTVLVSHDLAHLDPLRDPYLAAFLRENGPRSIGDLVDDHRVQPEDAARLAAVALWHGGRRVSVLGVALASARWACARYLRSPAVSSVLREAASATRSCRPGDLDPAAEDTLLAVSGTRLTGAGIAALESARLVVRVCVGWGDREGSDLDAPATIAASLWSAAVAHGRSVGSGMYPSSYPAAVAAVSRSQAVLLDRASRRTR